MKDMMCHHQDSSPSTATMLGQNRERYLEAVMQAASDMLFRFGLRTILLFVPSLDANLLDHGYFRTRGRIRCSSTTRHCGQDSLHEAANIFGSLLDPFGLRNFTSELSLGHATRWSRSSP